MRSHSHFLISPKMDFWFMGGFSLVFLLVLFAINSTSDLDMTIQASWWAYYAGFVVNYPHFMHSYQLFYDSFTDRLRNNRAEFMTKFRLLLAGVAVPVILFNYFFWCYLNDDIKLLSYAVSAMFFFVGWHYTKQGYGALITLSVYKKIYYSTWEKRILYGNMYVVWAYAWLKINTILAQHVFYDIPYATLGLQQELLTVGMYALIVSSILAAAVILKALLIDKKGISINGITGYVCASYLWLILPSIHPVFLSFTPFFHSLQYLAFVYKFKISEAQQSPLETEKKSLRDYLLVYRPVIIFTIIGVLLGVLMMDVIPKQIDHAQNRWSSLLTQNFFLVTAILFINIHHYFIDNAFWRRDNPKVQQFLFKS